MPINRYVSQFKHKNMDTHIFRLLRTEEKFKRVCIYVYVWIVKWTEW